MKWSEQLERGFSNGEVTTCRIPRDLYQWLVARSKSEGKSLRVVLDEVLRAQIVFLQYTAEDQAEVDFARGVLSAAAANSITQNRIACSDGS